MVHYHIEFRIRGYAKRYAKELIYDIAKRFRVTGVIRRGKAVPHITLYGPFETNKQRQMVNEIIKVCSNYRLIPFTFRGFNYFDSSLNKVIYLDIEPSQALIDLRYDISKALLPITYSKSQEDKKGKSDFKFHSTIAFKDIDRKFNEIWNYISSKKKPEIKQHLLRVTIIKNSRILYEYDLIQQRLLNRSQALNRAIFASTIERLKSRHMPKQNNEEIDKDDEKVSILTRIRNLFG